MAESSNTWYSSCIDEI